METTVNKTQATCYPWQQKSWQIIIRQHQQHKLAHAFIIQAPPGCGQIEFADKISCRLLCENKASLELVTGCGRCQNCLLVSAGTHPDCFKLQSEAKSKQIKIEQIRDLNNKMQQTRVHGAYQIAIIDCLDQLNTASANALLKQLEEPVPNTIFLLLLHSTNSIPATIISRCQKLSFDIYTKESMQWLQNELQVNANDAVQLLRAASGGMLLARDLGNSSFLEQRAEFISALSNKNPSYDEISAYSKKYFSNDIELINCWLESWLEVIHQLVIIATGGCDTWLDKYSSIQYLFNKLEFTIILELFNFAKLLQQSLQYLKQPINKQLLGEDLWIRWSKIFK